MLTEQFQVVKQKTDLSHVMQWGDLSFGRDKVSDFEGGGATRAVLPEPSEKLSASAVPVRQIDLHNLFWHYTSSSNSEERIAHGKEMQQELARQIAAEAAYMRFLNNLYPGDAP